MDDDEYDGAEETGAEDSQGTPAPGSDQQDDYRFDDWALI